ncbi:MAG: hypothetical protein ABL867_07970 [Rickettsiales bacterium]
MFKKLLPVVMLVFVTACANTQGGSMSGMDMKMPCCEKCECCKNGKCADCCKDGECKCCKDGMCKMCMGKMEGMSSMKEGEQCPMCAKMKQGKSPSPAIKQSTPATDHSTHH